VKPESLDEVTKRIYEERRARMMLNIGRFFGAFIPQLILLVTDLLWLDLTIGKYLALTTIVLVTSCMGYVEGRVAGEIEGKLVRG